MPTPSCLVILESFRSHLSFHSNLEQWVAASPVPPKVMRRYAFRNPKTKICGRTNEWDEEKLIELLDKKNPTEDPRTLIFGYAFDALLGITWHFSSKTLNIDDNGTDGILKGDHQYDHLTSRIQSICS